MKRHGVVLNKQNVKLGKRAARTYFALLEKNDIPTTDYKKKFRATHYTAVYAMWLVGQNIQLFSYAATELNWTLREIEDLLKCCLDEEFRHLEYAEFSMGQRSVNYGWFLEECFTCTFSETVKALRIMAARDDAENLEAERLEKEKHSDMGV